MCLLSESEAGNGSVLSFLYNGKFIKMLDFISRKNGNRRGAESAEGRREHISLRPSALSAPLRLPFLREIKSSKVKFST